MEKSRIIYKSEHEVARVLGHLWATELEFLPGKTRQEWIERSTEKLGVPGRDYSVGISAPPESGYHRSDKGRVLYRVDGADTIVSIWRPSGCVLQIRVSFSSKGKMKTRIELWREPEGQEDTGNVVCGRHIFPIRHLLEGVTLPRFVPDSDFGLPLSTRDIPERPDRQPRM